MIDRAIAKGEWHHLVRTFDPSAGFGSAWPQRYYLDGQEIHNVSDMPNKLIGAESFDERAPSHVDIGQRRDGSSRQAGDSYTFDFYWNYHTIGMGYIVQKDCDFAGNLSDVAIWLNHDMTASDVQMLYDAGPGPAKTGPQTVDTRQVNWSSR